MLFSRKDKTFKCCTRNINVLFLCREDHGFMMVPAVRSYLASWPYTAIPLMCLSKILDPVPSLGQNLAHVPAIPRT